MARLSIVLVLLAVLGIFSPALQHPFIQWDDDVHLYDNPHVRKLDAEHVRDIFSSDVNKTYIPLTTLSFAFEYVFAKDRPFLYHLDNVLLHLAVVFLVYALAMRLGLSRRAAIFAAFLFGVHPMHVESVAWVTQRKDVLYSFFYLLACWNYVGFIHDRRTMTYIWAILFAFLSILTKPMALSLPLILLLIDWYVKGPINWARWVNKVPFFLVIVPFAWLTYQMNMRGMDLEFPKSVLIWLWSLAFYLQHFFFPHEFLVLYQLPQPVVVTHPPFIQALAVALLFLTAVSVFRKNRLVLFASLYFFLSIFFLLRMDTLRDLSFVADRFMYLPSLGFCLLFGYWADRLIRWRAAAVLFLGVLFSVLSVITYRYVRLWGDEYLLWSKVTQRYPLAAAAYNQLGNYFLANHDFAQALTYYDKVIALDPRYHKPYGNRGVIHLQEGNFDAAIADFTIALKLNPNDSSGAYNNRGYAYLQMRDFSSALMDFHRALARDPFNVRAYINRATVYKNQGEFQLAMDDLLAAQRLNPDDRAIQSNIQWLKKRMVP